METCNIKVQRITVASFVKYVPLGVFIVGLTIFVKFSKMPYPIFK